MEEYHIPIVEYRDDIKNSDTYVRIAVVIDGLTKSLLNKSASNADITLDRTNRSICLTVVVKVSPVKRYRYEVQKLPADILTDETKTRFTIEKNNEIVIYLHKAVSGSWNNFMHKYGLDMAIES